LPRNIRARYNLNGNARTKTGFDMRLEGVCTDDCNGIRVNVASASSTNQTNVNSANFEGGRFNVYGSLTMLDNQQVEIGNNISMIAVTSGAQTGTDDIYTLIQPSVLFNHSVSTGPFGLDKTFLGVVPQFALDTGVTAPLVRALLLGSSLPQGSGGTLDTFITMSVLGLKSFGGSATVNNLIGIDERSILGQDFCSIATNCWFIKTEDPLARVDLAGEANANNGFRLSTSGAQPTCDADHRGLMWNVEGGAGVADDFQVCQKDATDTYVWTSH